MAKVPVKPIHHMLEKVQTGIRGFDEITQGGIPKGRTTLVCGGPGTGKTMMALEFLVRGAKEFKEPGVFFSFEESVKELRENAASLDFDVDELCKSKLLLIDYIKVERDEIEETGEYDLEGMFIRLDHAINTIGAKRVVLDTIESLFAGLPNAAIVRAELRRLFRWLKDKGMTTIVTGERGNETLTREGLEEYVSDCVISLDHRISEQVSTRRMRIVKYRGSKHGTNEYPFMISDHGFMVLPITSMGLDHKVSTERISTGIPRLDAMLGGKGYYRGSFILLSGTAGTGKTSVGAKFAESAGSRGERSLYYSFEESQSQIIRNMASIGINLKRWLDKGLLHIHSQRSTLYGLEHHLMHMQHLIHEMNPSIVIVDPISNFYEVGTPKDVKLMLSRLNDMLKSKGITALLTCLTSPSNSSLESTTIEISSLSDTWLLLRDIELDGERNRAMYILKSRGMAHSNQIREFVLTSRGIDLLDVYVGPEGVLTGSSRINREASEAEFQSSLKKKIEYLRMNLEKRRGILDAEIAKIRSEFEIEKQKITDLIHEEEMKLKALASTRRAMASSRKADGPKKAR
ncbi:MAG TPA: circadian clock protein KaiC [Desulfomonilia bacterium]|nr:circadian clock protein KaiC [Desulfomonilia bacterium]